MVTNHFTQIPCGDQTAKQMARVLWDQYFCVFEFHERIHSDQSAYFESHLISEFLEILAMKKLHATPYHLMGDWSVE